MPTINDLYQRIDPFDQRQPLASINAGDGRELVLRHFSPTQDLLFIYQWMNSQFHRHFGTGRNFSQSMYNSYVYNLESNIVQCLMVTHNNEPLMQVDIVKGEYENLKHPVAVTNGDAILHNFISPNDALSIQLLAEGMKLCMAWFFSFRGLERVFTELPGPNLREEEMLIGAGFNLMPTKDEQPQDGLLYCFTQADLKTAPVTWHQHQIDEE